MAKSNTASQAISEKTSPEKSSHPDDDSREKHHSDGGHARGEKPLSRPSLARSKPTRLDISLTVCFDCFLALLAIIFIAFGALAYRSDGELVNDVSYADALLSAVQLGPTFFPMVFALIAVRLIKAVHRVKASRDKQRDDAQVKVLQQLLDSRTIGDTLVTIAKLKTINLAGILLLVLWAFSPLGGQASLRIATEESYPYERENVTFSYVDYNTIYSMYTGSEWWNENIDIVKAIYSTSLISSNRVRQSSQDAWQNLKVPALEQLGPLPQNRSIWIEVPANADVKGDTNDNIYSSLVGIPVASNISSWTDPVTDAADSYTATYHLETMYMYLGCANISLNNATTGIDLRQGWSVASSANGLQIATNSDERSNFNSEGPTTQRQLYYQALGTSEDSTVNTTLVSTTCNITSTYVELNISCVESSCWASHIRPSQQSRMSELWTPLDYNSSAASSFFGDFVNATVPRQLTSSSPTEWFLTNPSNSFGLDSKNSYADYSGVDSGDFSLRLTQLLNAYYLANIAPAAVTGDLITDDWVSEYPYDYTTTPGNITTQLDIIVCHRQWLGVLIFASVVMMCCGFACAVIAVLHPSTDDFDIGVAMKSKRSKAFGKKLGEFLSDD